MLVRYDEKLIFVGLAFEHSDQAQVAFHVHSFVVAFRVRLVVEGHAERVYKSEALRVIVCARAVFPSRVGLSRLRSMVALRLHEGM